MRHRGRMRPPWPILWGPLALLQKSRRLRKLLLLSADSTLLYVHRWFPLLCASRLTQFQAASSVIMYSIKITGDTVHHFSLNCWLRPPKIFHWVDVAPLRKKLGTPVLRLRSYVLGWKFLLLSQLKTNNIWCDQTQTRQYRLATNWHQGSC